MKLHTLVLSFILLLHSNLLWSADFLQPDAAFQFSSQQNAGKVQLKWAIADGYYLYKSRFSVLDAKGNSLPLIFTSPSHLKQDKNFGEVQVFLNKASALLDLDDLSSSKAQELVVEYQGCSKKGLCYQPQSKTLTLSPFAASAKPLALNELSDTASINQFLQQSSLITIIGIFFLLGIGLSVTPCILPMIPILSGIIVGQGQALTARRGLLLSSAYVLGMALTYSLAGVAAATFGAKGNLQLYMQNPWVLTVFSLIFVLLAMSMFGFYNLALPNKLQNALNNLSQKQKGGQLSGVFIMGSLSALVVSPCVSAPLAGALVFISSTGDKLIGAAALFVLGLGLGLPLLAIGAGGGKLVPKAGAWMEQVKALFATIMLAVAIWLMSRILPGSVSLLLWALLFISYAIATGAIEPAPAGFSRVKKAASFTLLIYGSLLFLGALMGNSDPLKPLNFSAVSVGGGLSEQASPALFTRVSSAADLQQAIKEAAQNQSPVILDFYADWCTACVNMEKNVFHSQQVKSALSHFTRLQIDVTANTEDDQILLDQFGLFGPPSILFFDAKGLELEDKRIQGELSRDEFIEHVNKL